MGPYPVLHQIDINNLNSLVLPTFTQYPICTSNLIGASETSLPIMYLTCGVKLILQLPSCLNLNSGCVFTVNWYGAFHACCVNPNVNSNNTTHSMWSHQIGTVFLGMSTLKAFTLPFVKSINQTKFSLFWLLNTLDVYFSTTSLLVNLYKTNISPHAFVLKCCLHLQIWGNCYLRQLHRIKLSDPISSYSIYISDLYTSL